MLNINKNCQLYLSKNYEYFNYCQEFNINKNGLKKSKTHKPGNTFLLIFNNLESILKVLEKGIAHSDKQITSVTNFINSELSAIDPFIAFLISTEIQDYYHSLVKQREANNNEIAIINNTLKELEQLKDNPDLYNNYFENKITEQEYYIDSIAGNSFNELETEHEINVLQDLVNCLQSSTSGEIYIKNEIKELSKEKIKLTKNHLTIDSIHESIRNYIENLQNLLLQYQNYFDLYFGIIGKNILKKKDICYFQPIFNFEMKIPAHSIYACTENNQSIYPIFSKLSIDKIINVVDILKENNKIFYLNKYEINSLTDILGVYFYFFIQEKIWIKRCVNCGKYFIPSIRCDSKYCSNIIPGRPDKTCKDIGAELFHLKNIASDPIKAEHKKTKAKLYKRTKRASNEKDLNKETKIYNTYLETYEKLQKKYKKGSISQNEFLEWIKNQ